MNSITRHIPGTKAYSESLKAKIWAKINEQKFRVYALNSLSDDEKDELFSKTKFRFKKIIIIEEKFDKLISFIFGCVFVPWAIYAQLALPFQINNHFNSLNYSGWLFFYFFILFLLFMAIFLVGTIIIPFSFNISEHNKRRAGILQGCYFFIVVSLMFYFPYKNLGQEHCLLVNAIYTAIASSALYLTGIAVILLAIMEPLGFFLKTRQINKIPEAKLIRELIKLMRLSEGNSLYRNTEKKVRFMFLLEKSALLIEKKVPNRLDSFDRNSKEWVRRNYAEIAFTLRILKREISLAGPMSKVIIVSQLKDFLVKAGNNNWKAITKTKLPKEMLIERAKNKTFFYVRTIIVAFVPFTLIWLNKHYSLIPIDSVLQHYIDITSVLWFIISILIIIDPALKDKISAIKDVASYKGFKDSE